MSIHSVIFSICWSCWIRSLSREYWVWARNTPWIGHHSIADVHTYSYTNSQLRLGYTWHLMPEYTSNGNVSSIVHPPASMCIWGIKSGIYWRAFQSQNIPICQVSKLKGKCLEIPRAVMLNTLPSPVQTFCCCCDCCHVWHLKEKLWPSHDLSINSIC